jgi:fibronectin type 3 domain-containing protein
MGNIRNALTSGSITLGLLLTGCASGIDWPSIPWPESRPVTPEFREEPAADLSAPENLRATSGELRSVPLKWEPLLVGDVAGYLVERAATRDGPFERIAQITGRLATTYVDRDTIPLEPQVSSAPADGAIDDASEPLEIEPSQPLSSESTGPIEDGITWFYRVRAYTTDGRIAPAVSAAAAATTAPPPEPPEDLRAYSRQPRNVPVSWRASDDPSVTGYRVERSPTSSGPFELLGEIDERHETIYVDRGLGDLRVFYYRVAAVNAAGGAGPATKPVRAVTKPEPLPPVKLRVSGQRLGANELAWDPNVEEDVVEYRLFRMRAGHDRPEQVAVVNSDQNSATDDQVAAGERVSYSVIALDRDRLQSDPAEAVEVASESYGLSATARPDGVHLEWNPRTEEGYIGGRVTRTGVLQQRTLGLSPGSSFIDTDVKPGSTYRYFVVLEGSDQRLAPRSSPVEISIPKRPTD